MTFNRNFSIISIRSKAELGLLAAGIMGKEGAARRLGLDEKRLGAFVRAVGRRYRNNPYHNFQHAVDTTNTMAWFLTLPAFRKNLPDSHKFLLLVGALVHDIEHPGHDNQWEQHQPSPWAKNYPRGSILENHSVAVARELLSNPARDVFSVFSQAQRGEMERLFEAMILSTDFACHQDFVREFSRALAAGPGDYADPVFLSLVCRALLKAADIGNTAKPFPLARCWGLRVMKEYWAQGEMEKSHHIPLGPLNDPATSDFNLAQASFIKNSVLDLFRLLRKLETGVGDMVTGLEKNQVSYEQSARRALQLVK